MIFSFLYSYSRFYEQLFFSITNANFLILLASMVCLGLNDGIVEHLEQVTDRY
jgi:hypothetical protein